MSSDHDDLVFKFRIRPGNLCDRVVALQISLSPIDLKIDCHLHGNALLRKTYETVVLLDLSDKLRDRGGSFL